MDDIKITSRTRATVDTAPGTTRVRITSGHFTGRFIIFQNWFIRGMDHKQAARKAFDILRKGVV